MAAQMSVKWYFQKGTEVFIHSAREQYCCAATAGPSLWPEDELQRREPSLNTEY